MCGLVRWRVEKREKKNICTVVWVSGFELCSGVTLKRIEHFYTGSLSLREKKIEKRRWDDYGFMPRLLFYETSVCLSIWTRSHHYIYITGNHITHFFLLSDLKEIHVHRCCMLHTHLPQQCTWWWCHTLWYTYIYMYKIKSGPYVLLTYDWFTYSFIPSVLCGSTYVPESGWPCGFTHVPTRI